MKLWNEFLGFMVLSGPLVVMVPWLLFCVWAGAKAAKRFTSGSAKFAVGLGVMVTLMAPVADEIAGSIYLNHLCATEAGVKVYRTVELPAEYWDEQRMPRFINARGVLDMAALGDRFQWHNVDEPYIDSVIKIEKWRWELVDKETQNLLGEKITFVRRFGWINSFSPAPNIGESCRDLEVEQEKKFLRGIFKPATSTR